MKIKFKTLSKDGSPLIGSTITNERTGHGEISDIHGVVRMKARKTDLISIKYSGHRKVRVIAKGLRGATIGMHLNKK